MKTNKNENKQTNKIRRKIVFFFMSFIFCFMQSCSTEDIVIEQQSTIETVSKNDAITFVKNLYDEQRTTAKISGLQTEFIFDKVTQEKLTNTSELLTVIPIKTKAQNQRRRALFLRVGSQIESMIYHEFAQSSFTNETFTGIVLMTRLNGDFIRAYRLKNNEYVIDLVPSKKLKSSQKTTMRSGEVDYELGLDEVVVYSRFTIFNGFVPLTNLGNEVPISITWDPNYNGGGGSGGGTFSAIVVEEDFEDKIDDTKLNPCLTTILVDLKKLEKGKISELIKTFSGSTPGYNWEMKSDITKSLSTTGSTSPIYNPTTKSVTSTFHPLSFPNATDLSWARTIMHEGIHAYLVTFFATDKTKANLEFSDLVVEFAKTKDLNTSHHEEFIRKFKTDLSVSLQEYGVSKGYSLTKEFYDDMSWAGLHNTTAFEKLDSKTKDRILSVIASEATGKDFNGIDAKQQGSKIKCDEKTN